MIYSILLTRQKYVFCMFYHDHNSIKRDEGDLYPLMMAYFLAVKTFNESLDGSTLLPYARYFMGSCST